MPARPVLFANAGRTGSSRVASLPAFESWHAVAARKPRSTPGFTCATRRTPGRLPRVPGKVSLSRCPSARRTACQPRTARLAIRARSPVSRPAKYRADMAAPMLLHDFLFDIGAEVVPFQPVPGSCPSLCRPGGDARGHLRFRARRLLSRGHQAPGANRRRGTSRIGELPRSAHAPTAASRPSQNRATCSLSSGPLPQRCSQQTSTLRGSTSSTITSSPTPGARPLVAKGYNSRKRMAERR